MKAIASGSCGHWSCCDSIDPELRLPVRRLQYGVLEASRVRTRQEAFNEWRIESRWSSAAAA